jgi:hypothetical protein
VILGLANLYAADAVERELPDAVAARRLLEAKRPDIPPRVAAMIERIGGDDRERHESATLLALARLGRRHGGFGEDPHTYHNEDHILEVGERRLSKVLDAAAAGPLVPADAQALLLFAACHDLRQRETFDAPGPVGGNEASSVSESFRILDACGFDRGPDRDVYTALELMIVGSTFDARPPSANTVAGGGGSGGALARHLSHWLDQERPHWQEDPGASRGERLGRLAADLDTANVSEPFPEFAASAVRLCREIEYRCGRDLKRAASVASTLHFLTHGQQAYFFDLHRFCSREGERVFGRDKLANAPRLRAAVTRLTERFDEQAPRNGLAVIEAFAAISQEV